MVYPSVENIITNLNTTTIVPTYLLDRDLRFVSQTQQEIMSLVYKRISSEQGVTFYGSILEIPKGSML